MLLYPNFCPRIFNSSSEFFSFVLLLKDYRSHYSPSLSTFNYCPKNYTKVSFCHREYFHLWKISINQPVTQNMRIFHHIRTPGISQPLRPYVHFHQLETPQNQVQYFQMPNRKMGYFPHVFQVYLVSSLLSTVANMKYFFFNFGMQRHVSNVILVKPTAGYPKYPKVMLWKSCQVLENIW